MKKYLTLTFLILMVYQGGLLAQNHYKIRLDESASNNASKSCFNIQLAAADNQDLNLAGQNYRLYYDAKHFELIESSAEYLLQDDLYHNFTVKNFISNSDASGVGHLPFNEKIGFLNLSVDLLDYKKGGVILDENGEWKSTCQVCFNHLKSETSTNGKIIWAREDMTSTYATAFVEVAEWVEIEKTEKAIAADYEDLSFVTSTNFLEWDNFPHLYPNPTQDFLSIEQLAELSVELEIWGIQGNLVHKEIIPKGVTLFKTDMRPLVSGMYQIRLTKGNKQYTQLIEKLK